MHPVPKLDPVVLKRYAMGSSNLKRAYACSTLDSSLSNTLMGPWHVIVGVRLLCFFS